MAGADGAPTKWWETLQDPKKLLEFADCWSLAGDAATGTLIRNISQTVVEQSNAVSDKLEALVHNVHSLDAQVSNTNNSFTLLSHSQFIENRTYRDDDARAPATAAPSSCPEEKEPDADRGALCREALKLGLTAVREQYDSHVLHDSDDDDDEMGPRFSPTALYTVAQPYAHRPLPHVILSPEFLADPHVGLKPPSSDEDPDPLESDRSSDATDDIGDVDLTKESFAVTSSNAVELSDTEDEGAWPPTAANPHPPTTAPHLSNGLAGPPPDEGAPQGRLPASVLPGAPPHRRREEDSDSEEEFFKPVITGRRPQGPPHGGLQPTVPPPRRAMPASSDSEDDGLFSVGRRPPPPLPPQSPVGSSSSQHRARTISPAPPVGKPPRVGGPELTRTNGLFGSESEDEGALFGRVGPPPLPPGTSALPPGTSALPPGTSALPPGTSALPPGTSALPPGTSALPPGTSALPPGTSALPPGTSALPPGASALPPSSSALPQGASILSSASTNALPPTTTTASTTDLFGSGDSDDAGVSPSTAPPELTVSGRKVPAGGVNIFSSAVTAAIRDPQSPQKTPINNKTSPTPPLKPQPQPVVQRDPGIHTQNSQENNNRLGENHRVHNTASHLKSAPLGPDTSSVMPRSAGPRPETSSVMPRSDALGPETSSVVPKFSQAPNFGLFDDDDEEDDDLFGVPSIVQKPPQPFAASKVAPIAPQQEQRTPHLAPSVPQTAPKPSNKVTSSLFSSDDDDIGFIISPSSQPASATGSQPGSAAGFQAASAVGSQPVRAPGSQPASVIGTQLASAAISQPVSATTDVGRVSVYPPKSSVVAPSHQASPAPVSKGRFYDTSDDDGDLFTASTKSLTSQSLLKNSESQPNFSGSHSSLSKSGSSYSGSQLSSSGSHLSSSKSGSSSSGSYPSSGSQNISSGSHPSSSVSNKRSFGSDLDPNSTSNISEASTSKVTPTTKDTSVTNMAIKNSNGDNLSKIVNTNASDNRVKQTGGIFSSESDDDLFEGSFSKTVPVGSAHSKPSSIHNEANSSQSEQAPSIPSTSQITEVRGVQNEVLSHPPLAQKPVLKTPHGPQNLSSNSPIVVIPPAPEDPISTTNLAGQYQRSELDSSDDDLFLKPSDLSYTVRPPRSSASSEEESFPSISNAIGFTPSYSSNLGNQNESLPAKSVAANQSTGFGRSERETSNVGREASPKTPETASDKNLNEPTKDLDKKTLTTSISSDPDDLFGDVGPKVTGSVAKQALTFLSSDEDDLFKTSNRSVEAAAGSASLPKSSSSTAPSSSQTISSVSQDGISAPRKPVVIPRKISSISESSSVDLFGATASDQRVSPPLGEPQCEHSPEIQSDADKKEDGPDSVSSHPEQVKEDLPVAKKPPVGGIALFGGSELLAKVQKRRVDLDERKSPHDADDSGRTTLDTRENLATPRPNTIIHSREASLDENYGQDISESPCSSEASSPRKKPVGGVSMFGANDGGAELFAKLRKRQSRVSESDGEERNSPMSSPADDAKEIFRSSQKEAPNVDATSKPAIVSSKPTIAPQGWNPVPFNPTNVSAAPNFGPVSFTPSKPVASQPTSAASKHSSSSLPSSTGFLAVPSYSPFPGGGGKLSVEAASSFDEPASVDALANLNKERPRMSRRRPPSRKGRNSANPSTPNSSSTTQPSISTSLPATSTALPATSTALPATSTALPATSTALPATSTALPATSTTLPATTTPGSNADSGVGSLKSESNSPNTNISANHKSNSDWTPLSNAALFSSSDDDDAGGRGKGDTVESDPKNVNSKDSTGVLHRNGAESSSDEARSQIISGQDPASRNNDLATRDKGLDSVDHKLAPQNQDAYRSRDLASEIQEVPAKLASRNQDLDFRDQSLASEAPKIQSKIPAVSNVLVVSDSDDDLFGSVAKPSAPAGAKTVSENSFVGVSKVSAGRTTSSSMISKEILSNSLTSKETHTSSQQASSSTTSQKQGPSSMAVESENSSKISGISQEAGVPAALSQLPSKASHPSSASSLFDDEDDDDLFSGTSSVSAAPSAPLTLPPQPKPAKLTSAPPADDKPAFKDPLSDLLM